MTVRYQAGNEHNPADPFGRTELTLEADGSARLDHHTVGEQRSWSGRVEAGVVERLQAALERAGFPQVERVPMPAGTRLRTLIVESPGAQPAGIYVPWHAARDLDGYDQAFALLDSLVTQLSEGSVPVTTDTLGAVVADVRRVD